MYKYINIWISYDKVADKMNRLAAQGYEYDKEYLVAVRMKQTSETNDKQYKFIYDKNFTPETAEYYKASGWKLHKFKFYNIFRLAEGDSNSYPIYTDTETELEIARYRLLRFIIQFIIISMIAVLFFTNKFAILSFAIQSKILSMFFILLSGLIGGMCGYCIGGLAIFIPKYFKLKKELKLNSD